jgi:hypothetical protein
MGRPEIPVPGPRHCLACGKELIRKRYNGRMEDRTRFIQREHCNQACANSREEVTLGGMRARAKALRGSACERCGATTNLHAHHRDHNPAKNIPSNIETLCHPCHAEHYRQARATARTGVSTSQQSADGKPCSDDRCQSPQTVKAG